MGPEGSHINLTLPFVIWFGLCLFSSLFFWLDCLFCFVLLLWLLGLQQTHQTTNQKKSKETPENQKLAFQGFGAFFGEGWQSKQRQ